jgi:hypothetical protein
VGRGQTRAKKEASCAASFSARPTRRLGLTKLQKKNTLPQVAAAPAVAAAVDYDKLAADMDLKSPLEIMDYVSF